MFASVMLRSSIPALHGVQLHPTPREWAEAAGIEWALVGQGSVASEKPFAIMAPILRTTSIGGLVKTQHAIGVFAFVGFPNPRVMAHELSAFSCGSKEECRWTFCAGTFSPTITTDTKWLSDLSKRDRAIVVSEVVSAGFTISMKCPFPPGLSEREDLEERNRRYVLNLPAGRSRSAVVPVSQESVGLPPFFGRRVTPGWKLVPSSDRLTVLMKQSKIKPDSAKGMRLAAAFHGGPHSEASEDLAQDLRLFPHYYPLAHSHLIDLSVGYRSQTRHFHSC